jgi:hypothetical protein
MLGFDPELSLRVEATIINWVVISFGQNFIVLAVVSTIAYNINVNIDATIISILTFTK